MKAFQNRHVADSSDLDDDTEYGEGGHELLKLNSNNETEVENAALSTKQEAATITERIKASLIRYLTFVRKNKRNLAAAVCLWFAFVTTGAAYSLLAPFFPQKVTTVQFP